MKIRFIGFGGAFDTHLVNSAAIASHSGTHTLIDCGHSVFPALKNSGAIQHVDQVVITHLHDDHVGSLSAFAIYYSKVLQKGPLPIFGATDEFAARIRELLCFSLVEPERYARIGSLNQAQGEILAIDTRDRHMVGLNTYAFVFKENDESLVYSGDLGDCDYLFGELESMKIRPNWVFHELSYTPGARGHTYFGDLVKWASDYAIFGYHCDPDRNPDENPIPLVAGIPEFLWQKERV